MAFTCTWTDPQPTCDGRGLTGELRGRGLSGAKTGAWTSVKSNSTEVHFIFM